MALWDLSQEFQNESVIISIDAEKARDKIQHTVIVTN